MKSDKIWRSTTFRVEGDNTIVSLGPVHAYSDKFEKAKIFIRFQRILRPHVIVYESFLASTRKRENVNSN